MRTAVVCLLTAVSVFGGTSELRGRLTEGQEYSYDGYVVEITSLTDASVRHRADVFPDGTFSFSALPDGDYMVRVSTLFGGEITNALASVGPLNSGSQIEVKLPRQNLNKPASGSISLAELTHPPSKQVRKLLESGQKFIESKHFGDAAARFREAAKDDPQCAQAHADLGLALSRLENWNEAIEEYRVATTLAPRNAILHANLSAVLASAKRYKEAESEAGEALRIDPRNPRAHYVLAGVLLQTPDRLPEVATHLAAAQDAFAPAKAALEKLCTMQKFKACP